MEWCVRLVIFKSKLFIHSWLSCGVEVSNLSFLGRPLEMATDRTGLAAGEMCETI